MLRDALTPDQAETYGLQALAFLASNPEDLEAFLAQTGLDIDTLRAEAGAPHLLKAVIDYVLADDGRVTGLCEELATTPQKLHMASHVLAQADSRAR